MKKIVGSIIWLSLWWPMLAWGQLPALPVNQWTPIPKTTLRTLCKSPEGTGGILGDCTMIPVAWSSAAFDPVHDRYFLTGGGHSNYLGNDWMLLDLVTGKANRQQGPTLPPGPPGTSLDCLPDAQLGACVSNAKHTYDGLAWLPWLNAAVLIGGVPAPGGGFVKSIWLIDPMTHTELRLTDNYKISGPGGPGARTREIGPPPMVYDPTWCTAVDEAHRVVYAFDGRDLFALDPVANTFTRLTSRSATLRPYFTCAYDAKRQRVMVAGGQQFGYFAVAKGPTVALPTGNGSFVDLAAAAPWIVHATAPGMVYDADLDRLVLWGSVVYPNVVFLSDPSANYAWSITVTTGAQNPEIIGDNHGVYKRFAKSPAQGIYVYCGSMRANCLALQLAPTNIALSRLPPLSR